MTLLAPCKFIGTRKQHLERFTNIDLTPCTLKPCLVGQDPNKFCHVKKWHCQHFSKCGNSYVRTILIL